MFFSQRLQIQPHPMQCIHDGFGLRPKQSEGLALTPGRRILIGGGFRLNLKTFYRTWIHGAEHI